MAWSCIIEPDRLTPEVVSALCDALVRIDRDYLRRHPATPPLYQSGVRYQEEPPGVERWAPVGKVLELRYGDCEDLACWRCAELQERDGERATPLVERSWLPAVGWLYHVVVRRADGRIEDPSRLLGMT